MSKVVKAVNVMISHPERISQVMHGQDRNELFFVYGNKYKWSLRPAPSGKGHVLHFYPVNNPLEELAGLTTEWDQVDMVTYVSTDLGGREAIESMSELYRALGEKIHGVDEVLDDIIEEDDIPF